jgi:hypothetical protein
MADASGPISQAQSCKRTESIEEEGTTNLTNPTNLLKRRVPCLALFSAPIRFVGFVGFVVPDFFTFFPIASPQPGD